MIKVDEKVHKVLGHITAWVFFIAAVCCYSMPCYAANVYYVDASIGLDSYNGQTLSTPFLTIQKAANTMVAGDTCYIRAGTYRETLTVEANNQTFQNYNGEAVTISGCNLIPGATTWTSDNSYYETGGTVSMPLGTENQLFYNGTMMTQARWPINTGTLLQPTLGTVGSTGSDATGSYFIDNNLPDLSSFIVGTRLWVTAIPSYYAQTTTVTAFNYAAHKVYFNTGGISGATITAGDRYYLSGAEGYIGAQNNWYYGSDSKLRFYAPGGGVPNNSVLEIKTRELGIVLNGRSNTTISGINLFAAKLSTDGNSSYNTINSMNAQYVWQSINAATQEYEGMLLYGNYNTLENSTIQYSSGSLVSFSGTGHQVINCLIQYADYEAGQNAANIDGYGSNILISNNTISDSGRACIQVSLKSSQVQYNNMYNAVWLTKDCGVYYCGNTDGLNTRIHHNLVHDDKCSTVGGEGIYLDSYSENYIIDHNVVWNCYCGIHLNTPSDFTLVYNNTVDYCTSKSLTYYGTSYGTDMYGDQIFNNIFRESAIMTSNAAYGNNINSTVNPLFVNESGLNFKLQSASPAIDAGAPFAGINDNYAGYNPDCGAYEYSGAIWQAGYSSSAPSPMPTYAAPNASFMNFVLNGGFEAGNLSNWTVSSGTAVINKSPAWGNYGTSTARANNYSAKLGTGAAVLQQTVNGLEPNTWYTYSIWVLNSGETAAIGVGNFGGVTVTTSNFTNSSYTQESVNFETGPTNTQATIFVSKTSTGTTGYVYCDVAGLTEMNVRPAASNVALLGTMAVGDIITGNYSVALASGTAETGSTYTLLGSGSATNFSAAAVLASGNCFSGSPISYTITTASLNDYLMLEITPRVGVSDHAMQGLTVLSAVTAQVQNSTQQNITDDNFEGSAGSGTSVITLSNGTAWSASRTLMLSTGDGANTSTFMYAVYGGNPSIYLYKDIPTPLSPASGQAALDIRLKTPAAGCFYYLYLNDPSANTVAAIEVSDTAMYYCGEYIDANTAISNQQSDFVTTANSWYNIRLILNFGAHTAAAYVGPSVNNLMPFTKSKYTFNFYPNGTQGSYTMTNQFQRILFSAGNSGTTYPAGIDDVVVAYNSTQAVPSVAVSVSGNPYLGQTLTGGYTFTGNSTESSSLYYWISSSEALCSKNVSYLASGATTAPGNLTYMPQQSDVGKYITFRVIPRANAASLSSIGCAAAYHTAVILAISGGAMQFMNSGTAISSIGGGGSITGSTYVSNYTGYNVTAVLLLAHYKGTKLIDFTTSSAVISPGNGTQITTNPVAISATHTNESLKLFLWNGYGSLTPLTSSTIIS